MMTFPSWLNIQLAQLLPAPLVQTILRAYTHRAISTNAKTSNWQGNHATHL
jgi:hypothetical protein